MTTLKHPDGRTTIELKLDTGDRNWSDLQKQNSPCTAEFSRFKAQLKRAVDSVNAPQYLIDAIKTAIRS